MTKMKATPHSHSGEKPVCHQGTTASRGSILLVMLVSCLLLLVVLALATMSSININLIRSQVEFNQAFLTAQAAAAQLLYELDEFELTNNQDVDLTSITFNSIDLKKRYTQNPVFPSGGAHMTGEAIITFDDSKPYYSTDNSMSEFASKGWKDRNRDTRSVPSFAIDLITTVKAGGSTRYFESIIGRKWPYAAFCTRGPIIITRTGVRKKQMSLRAPCDIKGDLLSLYDPLSVSNSFSGGKSSPPPGPNPVNPTPDYGDFYQNLDPARLPKVSVCVGSQDAGDLENKLQGDACTAAEELSGDLALNPSLSKLNPIKIGPGNTHTGRRKYSVKLGCLSWERDPLGFITYPDKNDFKRVDPSTIPNIEVMGVATQFDMVNGTLSWAGPQEDLDKLLEAIRECAAGEMTARPSGGTSIFPPLDPDKIKENYPDLTEKIDSILEEQLTEAEKNEKTYEALIQYFQGDHCYIKKDVTFNGDSGNKLYLKGNLTNHYVEMVYVRDNPVPTPGPLAPHGGATTTGSGMEGGHWEIKKEEYSRAGLILNNCTLFVDGNVELGEFALDSKGFRVFQINIPTEPQEPARSIEGNNATLIVNGNVKLIGGSLDSKDKGMVIHARNMEFSTKGTYRGLILAQGAIVINPYPITEDQAGQPSEGGDQMTLIGAIASRGEVVEEEDLEEEGQETSSENSAGNTTLPGASTTNCLEGLVLKSVILDFDPRYVKVLHRFGKPRISVWQEIH